MPKYQLAFTVNLGVFHALTSMCTDYVLRAWKGQSLSFSFHLVGLQPPPKESLGLIAL